MGCQCLLSCCVCLLCRCILNTWPAVTVPLQPSSQGRPAAIQLGLVPLLPDVRCGRWKVQGGQLLPPPLGSSASLLNIKLTKDRFYLVVIFSFLCAPGGLRRKEARTQHSRQTRGLCTPAIAADCTTSLSWSIESMFHIHPFSWQWGPYGGRKERGDQSIHS